MGHGHEDGLDGLTSRALVRSAPSGRRIPARGGTPGVPTGNRGVLKERRIHRGYRSARPGCGVPSERIRCIDHPPRVATLGWYTPPPWGGTDTTQALLLEENRSKDPAQPWISNRQRSVDSGTLLRPGKEFSLRPDTDPPLCSVFAFKQWSPPWQIPTVPTLGPPGGGRRSV